MKKKLAAIFVWLKQKRIAVQWSIRFNYPDGSRDACAGADCGIMRAAHQGIGHRFVEKGET